MRLRVLLLAALPVVSCTCEASTGGTAPGGFDTREISLCGTGTGSASIRTRTGGRLELHVLDACGRPLRSCTTPDVFARAAVATVRISGAEILAEGCVLPAADASSLRAIFLPGGDASLEGAEHWEVALRTCADAAPVDAACPTDAGPRPDAARGDAALPADAAPARDAAPATDAARGDAP